ncbi:ABC transporter permease [Klenkia sp. LSe6-5]|uniref:ABC transporter permease n=1 Tax=Klenkia sesuvii TaxID=3103137 RepID=A0ABU8E185_9ACTN
MSSALTRYGLPLVLPIAILTTWAVLTANGESFYWPPLADIIPRIWSLWFVENFQSDFLPSLWRVLASWTLACGIGVVAGIVTGSLPVVRDLLNPLANFLRAIPAAALIPFTILAFGIGDTAKVFVITFVAVWPVFINTMDGVDEIDPGLVQAARAFRISPARRLFGVVLPAAAPRIATGMRTSLAIAVIVMLISEMVASTNGIGLVTIQAQRTFQTVDMWAGILVLGILGFVLNFIFQRVERRLLRWNFDSKRLGV